MQSFENVNIDYHKDSSSTEDWTIIIRLWWITFPPLFVWNLPEDFMRIIQDEWWNDFLGSLIRNSLNWIVECIRDNVVWKYNSDKLKINDLIYTIDNTSSAYIDEFIDNDGKQKNILSQVIENKLSKILNIDDNVKKVLELKELNLRILNFNTR